MATTVQIELTLDSSGALQGVTQLGDTIKKLSPPPSGVSKGFGDIEDQVKRAQQAVQGLSKITGIEVPAALENVMAKSKLLGPVLADALGIITGGEIGLAIVQMVMEVNDAFGKISDDLMGFTDKVKKNKEEMEKNNWDRFLHPASIEKANENLHTITGTTDKLREKQEAYAQELERTTNDTGEAMDGMIAAWMVRQQTVVTQEQQNKIDADSAEIQRHIKELTLQRSEAQAKGNEAGLKGLALIEQQHEDNIKLLDDATALQKFKQGDAGSRLKGDTDETYAARRKAIDAQFEAQKQEFERRSAESTIAVRHQVTEASLQGIAKVRQIETDALEDVDTKKKDGLLTDKDVMNQGVLIHQRATDQIKELERGLSEEVIKSEHEATLAGLKGEAAIRAAEDFSVGDLARSWQQRTGLTMDGLQKDTELWELFTRERTAIEHKGDVQINEMRRQATEELTEVESQARIAGLAEWDRGEEQIVADRDRTLRQIAEKMRGNEGDPFWDKWAARESAAAWATADAKIRDEHKRRVEQLGSDLESVFDDISSGKIGERILKNMKKFFFQIVAAWLEATGLMKTLFGKIFGTLFGGPGSSLEQSSGGGIGSLIGLFSSSKAAAPTTSTSAAAGTAVGATAAAGFLPAPSSAGGWPGIPWALPGGSSITGGAASLGVGAAGASGGAVGAGVGAAAGSSLADLGLGSVSLLGGAADAAGGLALKNAGSNVLSPFQKNVAALAALGFSIGGGLAGGKVGQVGGMLASLGVMALSNPTGPAAMLLSHLGMASSTAGLAAAGVGSALMAFGIGSNFGKLAGALGGGALGFGTGMLISFLGGPIGVLGALGLAAISAIAGLFGGFFGASKRKRQANAFANNQVLPEVTKIEDAYKNFSLDHASAISQLEDLRKQAQDNLGKLRGEGSSVMKNVVGPAIDHAEGDITTFEAERQRRAALTFGPPEFHTGGFVDTMTRSFTSRPGDLLAVLKRGEFVVNPQATAKNRRTLEAINDGGSAALSVGEIHIHPTTLDRAYVRTGFKQDLLDALSSLRKEGRL